MIKLYYADISVIKDEAQFETELLKVKEQRRQKVLRCKNEEMKYASLLAGLLLRHGMEALGKNYENLEFGVTPEGKPVIINEDNLYFSLSHSGGYVICGIANVPIGVDIEYGKRPFLLQEDTGRERAILQKICSAEEIEKYDLCPGRGRQELFLQLWTRKEAFSKALGKGFAMDLRNAGASEETFRSFWIRKDCYVSVYTENLRNEDIELCMMN